MTGMVSVIHTCLLLTCSVTHRPTISLFDISGSVTDTYHCVTYVGLSNAVPRYTDRAYYIPICSAVYSIGANLLHSVCVLQIETSVFG